MATIQVNIPDRVSEAAAALHGDLTADDYSLDILVRNTLHNLSEEIAAMADRPVGELDVGDLREAGVQLSLLAALAAEVA